MCVSMSIFNELGERKEKEANNPANLSVCVDVLLNGYERKEFFLGKLLCVCL